MIETLQTDITSPKLPTLADIEQRTEDLPAQTAPLSRHETGVAEPASPPAAALPTVEPPSQPEEPQHTLQSVFDEYALYGLAGEAVRTLAPHTEAQPEAILLQLLAAFGNVIGSSPHCIVGPTRHALNLFVVLVGEASKARKGTSWNQVARLFAEVDPAWTENRVTSTRLTAHGLTGVMGEKAGDRRLLILAEELAAVLHTMGRSRSPLSPLLRSAWDGATPPLFDRDRLLNTRGGHLSLIGHITQRELAESLRRTETHNGFANRCLWACVQRSQCLPDGGNVNAEQLSAVARRLRFAVEWVQAQGELRFRRDRLAGELWNDHYWILSQARSGLRTAATGRAEAQVLRLSALYAALDRSPIIQLPHLQAALALWDYCSYSAGSLFGSSVADSVADRILEALQAADHRLTRKQIRDLFHGHLGSGSIDEALEKLFSLGVATYRYIPGRGPFTTLWSATEYEEPEVSGNASPEAAG